MSVIKVSLGERSYQIIIGNGLLHEAGSLVRKATKAPKIAVVTNATVEKHYGKTLKNSLEKAGFKTASILIPDGEQYKNLRTMEKIYAGLLRGGFERSDAVLALGGGVVGDMAGFASATFMRGIDFIQFPTTLLAQVDSSVGGKTGVDFLNGKNMIGAFYQPKLVVCDLDTLKTLPKREYLCGIAETIKYGAIKDAKFFAWLEKSTGKLLAMNPSALENIVKVSCATKARVVEGDEREAGERAILNFGHTFGHGIETALNFKKLKHGEAVAIGMAMAGRLSAKLGMIDQKSADRIERLISSFGLPVSIPKGLTPGKVLAGMEHDKKFLSGKKRFVVLDKIGSAVVRADISKEDVLSACTK
jgi:3-dehydroquinate synthase